MKKIVRNNLINIGILSYYEFLFAFLMFKSISKETFISIIIYILFSSFVITLCTSLFNEKLNKVFNYIIYFIISLWFATEFTFKSFLDSFFSFSMLGIADQVTSFMGETFKAIFSNLYGILLFFLPFILLIIFRKKTNFNFLKKEKMCLLIYLLLIPLSFCSYKLYLATKKDETLSIYDLYYNVNNPNLAIQKLGVLSSARLDIYRSIFGFEEKIKTEVYEGKKEEVEIPKEIIYEDNTLNLILDDNTPDVIRNYIENTIPSKKNKYTGLFKGKNLVFVVAESYSEIAVSEELTPTLYKLTHSGFTFNNFYVPYYLSTIGGEFQAITGLFPDSSILGKWRDGTTNFPYGLATTFKNIGYNTYAYHNNSGYFQDRNKYLKSIGFDNFKACYMGLNINCKSWPQSDIEMIDKTYSDYMASDEPFLAYYMTVSGHFDYTFNDNYIASKNRSLVKSLPYTEKPQAYIACNIELDRALELLIKKLDEYGKLDDTVIVLLADHYPYALSLSEINEISSYERDALFEINHNSLILWNSKMESESIDKVGMPIDVIPTIYNLFGIDYDSRLFAGTDLLSDKEGLVILGNRSWITNKGRYNSTNSFFEGVANEEYVEYINSIIQNKVAFSKGIFTNNGYTYIRQENISN